LSRVAAVQVAASWSSVPVAGSPPAAHSAQLHSRLLVHWLI